jgi:hypothetical protein
LVSIFSVFLSSIFLALAAAGAFTVTNCAMALPSCSVYFTVTESPALMSAAVIALPPFLMLVFGSTANVHSASLPLSLPATTTLSAAADLTVPLAVLVVGFLSAFFSAFMSDFSIFLSSAFLSWATAKPAAPSANTAATDSAISFFTALDLQVMWGLDPRFDD